MSLFVFICSILYLHSVAGSGRWALFEIYLVRIHSQISVNKKRDRGVQNRQCTPERSSPPILFLSPFQGMVFNARSRQTVCKVLPYLYSI